MASSLVIALAVLSVQSTSGLRLGSSSLEKCAMPEPELQLRKTYSVAMYTNATNDGQFDSDYELLREGLKDHPMTELVDDFGDADYVFTLVYGNSNVDALPANVPREKIILIDWSDGPMIPPYLFPATNDAYKNTRWAASFKRSYVRKQDGVLEGVDGSCSSNCFPFAYGVMNQYLEQGTKNAATIGDPSARPMSLMCSLRPVFVAPGTDEEIIREYFVARNRVLSWLHDDKSLPQDAMISQPGSSGLSSEGFNSGIDGSVPVGPAAVSGQSLIEVGKNKKRVHFYFNKFENQFEGAAEAEIASESEIGPEYAAILGKSRIAVTANPASYEGDHRLWEHLASGNAVLSDHIYTPIPHAPKPGVHYMEYINADMPGKEEAFQKKLHKMLDSPAEMKKMACAGFQHAAKYHRSVSRVDYILRTMAEMDESEEYLETGQQLKSKDPVPSKEEQQYTSTFSQRHPVYFTKIA